MSFIGTITVEDYWGGDATKRDLADRLIATLHLDPNEVVEIRVSSASVSVDLLDRRTFTTRTVRYPWGGG